MNSCTGPYTALCSLLLLAAAALCIPTESALGQSGDQSKGTVTSGAHSGFTIVRDVNGGGGDRMEGTSRRLHGTVSQTVIGRLRRPDGSRHNVGFWYWAAGVEPFACIRIPRTEAEVGSSVTIPLLLEDATRIPPGGAFGFRATIQFNRSLLEPIGETPQCVVDGPYCQIEVEGVVTPEMIQSGVLAELDFRAMLGNAESTPVTIESFEWTNLGERAIRTQLKHGEFVLLGVCREGDEVRLVHAMGPASRVRVWPNPVRGSATIEYVSREEGDVEIAVVDALGRPVKTVLRDQAEQMKLYRVNADFSTISSGTYFLIYRTPSETKTMQLTVGQ